MKNSNTRSKDKNWIIKFTNPFTGYWDVSHTNSPGQRIKKLKNDIARMNRGENWGYPRFEPFVGLDPEKYITWEKFRKVN